MQFAHEKLSVYQKALEFFDHAQERIASWSKQHAFVDHLLRASESILFNLAENYIGFNCSVVFAENYLEAASASEPAAPVSLHPAA